MINRRTYLCVQFWQKVLPQSRDYRFRQGVWLERCLTLGLCNYLCQKQLILVNWRFIHIVYKRHPPRGLLSITLICRWAQVRINYIPLSSKPEREAHVKQEKIQVHLF